MITRLEIENFKAIRNLTVDLQPLTVLVGPNDSGKTTILQALDVLARATTTASLDQMGAEGDWQGYFPERDRTRAIRLAVEGTTTGPSDIGRYRYSIQLGYEENALRVLEEELKFDNERGERGLGFAFVLRADGDSKWHGESTILNRDARSGGFAAAVRADLSSRYIAFNPQALARPCPLNARFEPDGSGLAALLHGMLSAPDRRPIEALDEGLRRLSPHVQNVAVDTLRTPGQVEAQLALKPSRRGIYAREASMGLLLATGYLALMHGTTSQRFLVEEPENGVHPRALRSIVDVLHEMARVGRQVILTTHSPILLNYLEPQGVRVVTRDADGVHVTPIAETAHFDERARDFDLGELWYAIGEDTLVSNAS